MIDAATRRTLVDLLLRESRSLLMYVSESFPLTTPQEQNELAQILKMVEEEQQATKRLARFMQKQRMNIPPLGTFPIAWTTINFISIDYIVPLLITYQKQRIAEITADLAQISDPLARLHVQDIIDVKKRHAATLEEIRGKLAIAA